MVTINPADCKPDEVYEGTVRGERWTMRRLGDVEWASNWLAMHESENRPWEWFWDYEVSGLVRLVPAREVTRKDLPDFGAMGSVMARWKVSYGAVSEVLDAVVAHLNANGGLPAEDAHRRVLDLAAEVNDLKADRDQARSERDEAWRVAAEQTRLERDRAEAAERERDDAIRDRRQMEDDHAKMCREWRGMDARVVEAERDRDEWRTRAIEAAEARTAPAVPLHQPDGTRMDASHLPIGPDDDPAVFVVWESDVAAIDAQPINGGKWWLADGALVNMCESPNESEAQEAVDDALTVLVGALAARRAIEAESADPVEAKARELAGVMHEAIKDERVEWHPAPAAVDVMAARLAAHVLGQESSDE